MTLVIVNDFAAARGGASKVAVSSAIELARRGNQVKFFAGAGPIDPGLDEVGVEVSVGQGAPYNELPMRQGIRLGYWDPGSISRFEAFTASLDPASTIVHVHSNRDVLSASVIHAASRRFATLYTCHDFALGCPYGCFYNFQTQAPCGKVGMSLGCVVTHCNRKSMAQKIWAVGRQKRQIQAGVPDRLAAVIYVSEFSRRMLEPYARRARQWVLPNPIDALPNERRELGPDSPFLFVGALTVGKGVLVAAKAAARAGLPMVFVGDGEDREAIVAANPQAVMKGRLSAEGVLSEFKRARALLLPALWFETQGMVVAEALARGVPAVVSEQCAAAEMIRHGENGLLVPPNDEVALAAAMSALTDDERCLSMGEAAYEGYWTNPLTADLHLERLLAIYSETLG